MRYNGGPTDYVYLKDYLTLPVVLQCFFANTDEYEYSL